MAIKDFKPTASDPEVQQRTLANIEREFQTRYIGDSEEAARAYLKIMGITASDADVRTAQEKKDRARYDELREFNPFEASRFAERNPHVYQHGADRTNAAMNMARERSVQGGTPAVGDPFAAAVTRLAGGSK